jgi:hypothetical protein
MAEHIRIYGAYLWELCTAPILPFEFVSVADQFKTRIAELSAAGQSVGFASLATQADALGVAAQRLAQTTQHWSKIYANGSADDAPALALNACLKRLSRLLLPIVSTAKGTYGHDTFSYTPQSTVIPSLFDVPKLKGLPDGPDRWQLETQLIRERNRVSDALIDACTLIDNTLARLS